jgi:hypothetical protein
MKSARVASSRRYTLNDWEIDWRTIGPIQQSPGLELQSETPGDGVPTVARARSDSQATGVVGRQDEEDIPEVAVAPV